MNTREECRSLISDHVFQYNLFDESFKIQTLQAKSLIINPLRFDLIVKLLFVKKILFSLDVEWYNELYVRHIGYFNNFSEDNFPEKNVGIDFINSFTRLIDAYNVDNIAPSLFTIPIDSTNCPLDGAHRLAILAAKELFVTCVTLGKRFPLTSYAFNYSFFVKKGMPRIYTDFIALKYAQYSQNANMICLFPSSFEHWPQLDKLIKEKVGVFYQKEIYLTPLGKLNITINLYRSDPWLGNILNNYEGANYKMTNCFSQEGPLMVYLIAADSIEFVKKLKEDIRTICKIGNHSVHTTDSLIKTNELATIVFSDYSINFLNCVRVNSFTNFNILFKSYKTYIADKNLDANSFCIDGSAILSICNLRDCYDLDFLYSGDELSLVDLPQNVDCHNQYLIDCGYLRLLGMSIDEIVHNPRHHFYYEGLKVMIPSHLLQIKECRNEIKDQVDVELLKAYNIEIENVLPLNSIKDRVSIDWYNNFDRLMKSKTLTSNIPRLFLNARFSISPLVDKLIILWKKFINAEHFIFDSNNYFYIFEFYQELDFNYEYFFLEWSQNIMKEIDPIITEDAFVFQRICFTRYFDGSRIIEFEQLANFITLYHSFITELQVNDSKLFDNIEISSFDRHDLSRFSKGYNFSNTTFYN